jgi:hypothetical protein
MQAAVGLAQMDRLERFIGPPRPQLRDLKAASEADTRNS